MSAQAARARAVLVLEAPGQTGWKEGVQALVAELLTTGYELSVRAARAPSLGELQSELEREVVDSAVSAGVSIIREGDSATALMCRRDAGGCERVQMEVSDGELSRSRLALAVVERLRPFDLPAPVEAPARGPASVSPPRHFEARPAAGVRPLRAWLSGGAVMSSGTSSPIPWLGASLGLMVDEPWGVELALAGSPLAGRAETRAGSLSLRGFQATAFAIFEPFARRRLGFALGLGGGALRLQETASPAPGYDGVSRGVTIGVVSARARLLQRLGPVYCGLTIDPGMLVPAVQVEAGGETVLRIGRPWISAQASVGLEL